MLVEAIIVISSSIFIGFYFGVLFTKRHAQKIFKELRNEINNYKNQNK